MGFAEYKPTLGPVHDSYEPRRSERHGRLIGGDA